MKFLQFFGTVLFIIILPLSGLWATETIITANDVAANSSFSWRGVVIDGVNAFIGCAGDDTKGTDAGAAYMFHFNGSDWEQQQKLIPSDGIAGANFGIIVDIQGDWAIVGQGTSGDVTTGAAYIYHYNGSEWIFFQKLTPSSFGEPDEYPYGAAVSINGEWAMAGMPNY